MGRVSRVEYFEAAHLLPGYSISNRRKCNYGKRK